MGSQCLDFLDRNESVKHVINITKALIEEGVARWQPPIVGNVLGYIDGM